MVFSFWIDAFCNLSLVLRKVEQKNFANYPLLILRIPHFTIAPHRLCVQHGHHCSVLASLELHSLKSLQNMKGALCAGSREFVGWGRSADVHIWSFRSLIG